MKRFSWIAFAVGFSATVIVALLAWLGVLNNWEFDSVDWRYQHARSVAEPLSDQIALVVIDDSSLDTFGRWPWPRRRLAAAIDEISRAGARTVALDLQLSEPDAEVGGDDSLATAMAGLRTVLGMDVSRKFKPGVEWESPEGKIELVAIIDVLSSNIGGDSVEVADSAKLTSARRDSFLENPLWFKGLAAWKVIWQSAAQGQIPPLEDLIFKLKGGNNSGKFAERNLIEKLWDRARSWREFQEEVVHDAEHQALLGGHEHEPPIAVLAEKASGLGVVTNEKSDTDVDGAKRRTGTTWQIPSGHTYQLGLVSSATHMGMKSSDIIASKDSLQVGQTTIPLQNGIMELDWPTSTFDGGFEKWSQSGMEGQERHAVSIGTLIGLSDDREQQKKNEKLRDVQRAKVLGFVAEWNTPAIAMKSSKEFAEILDDARMNDAIPANAADAVDDYQKISEEVDRGSVDIAKRSGELRKKLNDKLVFLGWTATGALADFIPTPYNPKTPGVFVHAVVADMVLSIHSRENAPDWIQPLAIFLFGGMASLCACRLATGWSAFASAILVSIWLWSAGRFAFNDLHLIMPLVGPAIAPVASWALGTAAIAIVTSRDRARITRQFSARVSPQLVARLANNPGALTMSGQERQITVMFGDLAGFTTIAEQLGGPGVVSTLNLYLGRLSNELVDRDAYVNKFLGDGFMAFWSAFGDEPRQESLAAESAVACQAAMKELGQNSEFGSPKISVRLGIATGMAVVGDCGAPPKLNDYTAIGDVVNLSARLESANKQFGTGILIDGATHRGIIAQGGNSSIKIRALGAIIVVGQSKPIEIFEVVGLDADDSWIAATEHAVALFRDQKIDESAAAWKEFETRFGESKVSKMYLEAIELIREGEEVSDGVLRLRAK
ncbi:MAG: CHASE2 domain-containing protein [Planctomycetes bacterium]|nr:CHASE2 domain-containing protein [Planctomycetota bacterium]